MTPHRCERVVNLQRCDQPAVAFAMGQHVCTTHTPLGDQSCSHSLRTDGRCSYCGGVA